MAEVLIGNSRQSEGRGVMLCRGCSGTSLFSALDLGEVPIANELSTLPNLPIERFPLHLRICNECGLGQVAEDVIPTRIFRDYRYLSSMSSTFSTHAKTFVQEQLNSHNFADDEWVLEIASNDGYLLKHFVEKGVKVLGIEPAKNVAELSQKAGVTTISEFFSTTLAYEIKEQYGLPKLIIANNVMAHVPDLNDFISGLSVLCGPNTLISIENPSLANIAIELQFDTIYHEHYSYLTAFSVDKISIRHGLQLFRIEGIPTHGGSNRYWLRSANTRKVPDVSVKELVSREVSLRLFDSQFWGEITSKVTAIRDDFSEWLKTAYQNGERICGYGAAAKASTLLNLIEMDPGMILSIADISFEKQGRFMPPHSIEIVSPSSLHLYRPTAVVIFPWNIKTEIVASLRELLGETVEYWCAVPKMMKVEIE